jgi:NAD+ synthase
MRKIKLARINPELTEKQIGDFIIAEIINEGTNGGVVGLSGGVDSTVVAALAKRAFDRYNSRSKNQLELVGYILPSKLNSAADAEDGEKVAKQLGIRYETVNIEKVVEALKTTNPEVFHNDSRSICDRGNMISRARAVVLNTKASSENKIVIGTGNRDEDFNLGFYTLFGDGAVRISPIAMLPKRLVREMVRYLGFPDLAARVSSPGLEPGQTSFGTIGYNYETAEIISEGLEQNFSPEELARHPQILTAVNADISEYEKKFWIKKFADANEVISDIIIRKKIASEKSRIVHPPSAEITLIYNSE